MTRFHYRAVGLDGREVSGEVEGGTAATLAADLGSRGLLLLEARRVRAEAGWRGLLSLPPNAREVTGFLSDLALMLQSGQAIDEALALLAADLPGALGRTVRALHADLLGGTSFADALARQGTVFPPEVIALARVSESTGRLDRAIEAAARQRARMHALTEKLIGALQYPAFLLVAALGVTVFFLLGVIPQFADVLRDAGAATGAISSVFAASDLLRAHLDAFIGGALALLVAGLIAGRVPSLRSALAETLLRLPVIHETHTLHRTALFCTTLGTLLGQGVPLPEALKVLEAVLGGEVGRTLARIGDTIRRGGSLGDALDERAFLPPIARRMLKLGEESGELAAIAGRAGTLYETKLEKRLDRIAALVGPIAIITIAALIGGLMVVIMSALVSVNQLAT